MSQYIAPMPPEQEENKMENDINKLNSKLISIEKTLHGYKVAGVIIGACLFAFTGVQFLSIPSKIENYFEGKYGENVDTKVENILTADNIVERVKSLEVDKVNSLEWVIPDLESGWRNFDSGYQRFSYAKDSNGWVYLRGLVTASSSIQYNKPIFTLPEGFRPQRNEMFTSISEVKIGRIDVFSDGRVIPKLGQVGRVTLGSIKFYAGN